MKKLAIVTGANAGIGKATAKALAEHGVEVIMACRNKAKAIQARNEMPEEIQDNLVVMMLDLSSFASIRQFVNTFRSRYDHLDILVNNAGVWPQKLEKTEEGFEQQFGVNYLGHFLLTQLLLESMKAAPAARIVNVASMMHKFGRLDFGNLRGEKRYSPFLCYAQSKLAMMLFTFALAEELGQTTVTCNAVHPGVIITQMYDVLPSSVTGFLARLFSTPEEGASTSVYLALDEEVEGVTGSYFSGKKIKQGSALARSHGLQQKLWRASLAYCGLEGQSAAGRLETA